MNNFLETPSGLTQHVLQHDQCPLHFWTGGDTNKPLIVMMHGATMNHRMFNEQVWALLPHYHVLVWDARGHGKSQPAGAQITLDIFAQDMIAILDHLGIACSIVMGQSLGGYIAQKLYEIAPQRVQAMIIIGSTPIAKAYSKLEIMALKASLPLFDMMPYTYFSKMVARNTAITQPVQAYALEAVKQIPSEAFSTIWKAVTLSIDSVGKPDFLIDIPLLLMHGDQDKTGTIRRDMPRWAESESQAEYHVIPNAGHNANQDNPVVTNQLILAFLERAGFS